jgi:hypothetical protein
MKKVFFILLGSIMLASCVKSDKCKCKITVGDMTLENQIIARPDDTTCGKIKVEDIQGEVVGIQLTKLAAIKCVNYNE